MFDSLPRDARSLLDWSWARFEPFYADLSARRLNAETATAWLSGWSRISALVAETRARLSVAYTQDTTDTAAEARYMRFIETIQPAAEAADQKLREKLLACGLEPEGMAIPLRNMRARADLFRGANLPLQAEEGKLRTQYDKIVGAQTVVWEGREIPLPQLQPVLQDADRGRREQAWRLARARQLADRDRLNALWRSLLGLRTRIAANADCATYRDYAWRSMLRFDYTPDDCARFQKAIEEVCVPAANRVYERCRSRLGVASLRPWDLTDGLFGRPVDAAGHRPLRPFEDGQALVRGGAAILNQVDSVLGAHFGTMVTEGLLDLDNRAGKAPGGYCTSFPAARRPFIFMNAVGLHRDVQTLLHEAGHAFHVFEKSQLRHFHQLATPMEFNEVASMAMELLAAPYLTADHGGFYSPADAARARREHLEDMLLFWPYMAVVDAFQHWVYAHVELATDAARCDDRWRALWARYIPAIDWSGLGAEIETGWHRKLHIFQAPFYYVEYGLAALGAVQIWRSAISDPAAAVARYRRALALGGTAALPELYDAAGARFAFDAETLGEAVTLIERTVAELDAAIEREDGGGWG